MVTRLSLDSLITDGRVERREMSAWIERNLNGLFLEDSGGVVFSKDLVGGQSRADAVLAQLSVDGYARGRNRVSPEPTRRATVLSPYIRHGLLTLREVCDVVQGGPSEDVGRFVDELLWQEYARHLYNHIGVAMRSPLRYESDSPAAQEAQHGDEANGWINSAMLCLNRVEEELQERGWLVNQCRMWFASNWAVRLGLSRVCGEDYFFRHLLDGSRSANGLGWQWVSGEMTGKVYGFSKMQVERQAPDWCSQCSLVTCCPIEQFPRTPTMMPCEAPRNLRVSEDLGPERPVGSGRVSPEVIWITAEYLSLRQGALTDYSELPVVFVFDRDLLNKLQLSTKRFGFLLETLAEISIHRDLELYLGDPAEVLVTRPVVATWTPVPGWKRYARRLQLAVTYPWPWLVRSSSQISLNSYSAWRSSGPTL